MKRVIIISLIIAVMFITTNALALTPEQESNNDPLVRIKDITKIEGERSIQLIGYGLVVGLNGTGDGNSQLTAQSYANMMQRFGIKANPDGLNLDNVAAVMVTAKLAQTDYQDKQVDVTLSSIAGADSLKGGTLLMTPLLGPNQEKVYAEAQGQVSIGGFNTGQGGNQNGENHTTVGRIPNGATITREISSGRLPKQEIALLLKEPDFTTARRISEVINSHFGYTPQGTSYARAVNANTVAVKIPSHFRDNRVNFISRVNQLEVRPDTKARVVFNERTGTVVMGHNVRLSKVSVAHGDLTVTISTEEAPQPAGNNQGQAQEEIQTNNNNDTEGEKEQKLMVLPKGSTISDVVKALNAVGAKPGDIISILQAIKEAGALHAELEIM